MPRPPKAQNNPVSFGAPEVHTSDMKMTDKEELDISLNRTITRDESFVNVAGDSLHAEQFAALAFNEEPVTIRIEPNPRQTEAPETHVPVVVNGKGAEVHMNGQWIEMTWLPIGQPLTTKRKYVEVIARARSDHIKTHHDGADVERPRNTVNRSTVQNYPISVLSDKNQIGHEWLSRIMLSH